jgi:hypothetical protein
VVRRLIPDSVPRTIREAGLDFDLIDDDALAVVDPAAVPLVVVPDGTTMPAETRRWLDEVVAAGGQVITDIATLADQLPVAPLAAPTDVGVVHRRLDDGDLYFVANTGPEPRTLTLDEPLEHWNPLTAAPTVTSTITLHPYEAAILLPATDLPESPEPAEEPVGVVVGGWSVAFGDDVRGVSLPHRWEDDPALATYSGSATYSTEIELPATSEQILLDFGPGAPVPPDSEPYLPANSYRALITPPIGAAADIWLNDTHCGSLWAPPFRIDLTAAARPGRNHLRIVVHNTAANALSADQHLLDTAADMTARHGRRFDLQHVEYAATYLNSGLLVPPSIRLRSGAPAADVRRSE